MKKELEKDVQRAVLAYLTLRGIFHYKHNNVGIKKTNGSYIPSQSVGAPDIICIIKGQYVGLEIKTKTGRVSEHQWNFGKRIHEAGGIWYPIYSVDKAQALIDGIIAGTNELPKLDWK